MEKETKLNGAATEKQIAEWKEKHGDVWAITVGGSVCYLKRPSRKALSYASMMGKSDPLRFSETMLNECWLGGDERIKTDDSLFLGAASKVAELVEVKEAVIKKL